MISKNLGFHFSLRVIVLFEGQKVVKNAGHFIRLNVTYVSSASLFENNQGEREIERER